MTNEVVNSAKKITPNVVNITRQSIYFLPLWRRPESFARNAPGARPACHM